MNAKFWIAGVLSGIAMFIWGAASHMFFGWHDATYNSFRDEDKVMEVIAEEAPHSGIYIAPVAGSMNEGLTSEQRDKAMEEMWAKSAQGPNIFVSVRREGMSSMGAPMILDFLALVLMSFVMLWLLQTVPGLSFGGKVLFVLIAGTVGMALVQLEQWVWWSFSTTYVLVNIVDSALRWAVGGIVMAKMSK
jgi:hypothetical protein